MAILIFFHFLSYSLGISALVISILLYHKNKDRTLRYYIIFLAVFTVRITINLLLFYLRANADILDSSVIFSILMVYHISVDITYLMAFCLPVLFHNLFNPGWKRPGNLFFFIAGALILAINFYPYLNLLNRHISYYPAGDINRILLIAIIGVYGYLILLTFVFYKKMRDSFQKSTVFSILIFFLSFVGFDFLTSKNTYVLSGMNRTFPFLLNLFFYSFWNAYFLVFTAKSIREMPLPANLEGMDDAFIKKYGITEREKEIIRMVIQGKSNRTIAHDYFIALKTVKNHLHNIYAKTGVKSRMELSILVQKDAAGRK